MVHRFWTLTLFPGHGWVVTRWVKHGTLFAVVEEVYEGLMRSEAMDVLDRDSTWVIEQLLGSLGTEPARASD